MKNKKKLGGRIIMSFGCRGSRPCSVWDQSFSCWGKGKARGKGVGVGAG